MDRAAEKSLTEVVAATDPLARLLRAQRLFEALDREIQPVLSDVCRNRLRVACVDNETLVIAAQSSAWASRARLESAAVLNAARKVWPGSLQQVRIIVNPWTSEDDVSPR